MDAGLLARNAGNGDQKRDQGGGITFGRGVSILVRSIVHWPTRASLTTIIAAVAVSAAVGIAFGFYPAWKASR